MFVRLFLSVFVGMGSVDSFSPEFFFHNFFKVMFCFHNYFHIFCYEPPAFHFLMKTTSLTISIFPKNIMLKVCSSDDSKLPIWCLLYVYVIYYTIIYLLFNIVFFVCFFLCACMCVCVCECV